MRSRPTPIAAGEIIPRLTLVREEIADPTIAALEARRRALGRPTHPPGPVSMPAVQEIERQAQQWDAENPAKAAEWRDLRSQVEAREHELAEVRARVAAEARQLEVLKGVVGLRLAAALAEIRETKALAEARRWLTTDPAIEWALVLLGPPGNGKSVAAAWCAQQRLVRGRPVEWIRSQEVATQSAFGKEAQALKDRARKTDLLVLDDFGDESETPTWKAWLADVLGARYANCLRTVVTTNLDPNAFGLRVGKRLADRFRGMAFGVTCESLRKDPVRS